MEMDNVLADASAMTLTLIISFALIVGTVFIIVMGGRVVSGRDRAKPKRWHIEPEQRKAA